MADERLFTYERLVEKAQPMDCNECHDWRNHVGKSAWEIE